MGGLLSPFFFSLVVSRRPRFESKDRDIQREMSQALAKLFQVDTIDWNKQIRADVRVLRDE